MKRVNGHRFGIWSLRLDAIYCTILGVGIAVSASSIADVISLPEPLIAVVGIIVALWAGLVLFLLARLQLRMALRLVLGVNILAALLIAVSAATAGTMLAVVAVLAIAIDVALFAASQIVALRCMPTAQIERTA